MAKDSYDKIQIISAALKDNKAGVLRLGAALGSGGTNMLQYFTGTESAFMNKAMTEQITVLSKYYATKECKK